VALGATTEKQRKGIADYFTPTLVKTRKGSAGSNGLLGGSSLTDADNYPHRAGQTGTRTMTIPRDATGGPKDGGSKVKRTAVMQERLKEKLEANEKLRKLAKQVHMTMTPEGIRIDMLDDADFSMFRLGTTILTPTRWNWCVRSARRSRPIRAASRCAATPTRCNGNRAIRPTTGRFPPAAPKPRAWP
jgi:chemotaxis protein MotB